MLNKLNKSTTKSTKLHKLQRNRVSRIFVRQNTWSFSPLKQKTTNISYKQKYYDKFLVESISLAIVHPSFLLNQMATLPSKNHEKRGKPASVSTPITNYRKLPSTRHTPPSVSPHIIHSVRANHARPPRKCSNGCCFVTWSGSWDHENSWYHFRKPAQYQVGKETSLWS